MTSEAPHSRGSCALEPALSCPMDAHPDEGPTKAEGKGSK